MCLEILHAIWCHLLDLSIQLCSEQLTVPLTHTHTHTLTNCVVPAVDGKQSATCDSDGRRYAEVRESVRCDVGDRGVGGELEDHDDVLLHLILKHQRALGKETLVRQTERDRENEGDKGRARREG